MRLFKQIVKFDSGHITEIWGLFTLFSYHKMVHYFKETYMA